MKQEYRHVVKGSIAVCSKGAIGLVTDAKKRRVTYADGNTSWAYVGIHLTDAIAPKGSPWTSRDPKVLFHVEDWVNFLIGIKNDQAIPADK